MPVLPPASARPAGPRMPSPAAIRDEVARLRALWERSRGSTLRFIRVILGERRLWSKQEEVCHSLDTYHTTLIPAGNSVGKSFLLGRLALAFLLRHPGAIVYTTSPSQYQLVSILWKELGAAIGKSRIPLGIAPVGKGPIELRLSGTWYALGHVSNKIENTTGHHARRLLVLVDEGSGVPDATFAAAWSLNPSHVIVAGNPLHPIGRFNELCRTADAERLAEEAGGPRRTSNLIRIPSTSSPDIDKERSDYGLADQTFLRTSRRDYGEGSIWWESHVEALFPNRGLELAIDPAWIDLACATLHQPGGAARLAIDVATGRGGDDWVLLVRDDNGILDLLWDNTWDQKAAARQAKALCEKWRIPGYRVSWDKGGPGEFFGGDLAAAGLHDCNGYYGGAKAAGQVNMRSACAQLARWRLDPTRPVEDAKGVWVPQVPFSFGLGRKDWHAKLAEIGLFQRFLKGEVYALETNESIRERLRRSPDVGDCFFQSFGWGD